MTVLLVLHEIQDEQKRAKIVATLKKRHPLSIELTESAVALHTTVLPVRVFDQLKSYVSSEDRLYVMPLARPYTGYGPRATTEWLSDYLST